MQARILAFVCLLVLAAPAGSEQAIQPAAGTTVAEAPVAPGAESLAVPGAESLAVPGAESLAVPGAESLAVPGAESLAPGAESLAVPGAESLAVPGAESLAVPGAESLAVPGAESLAVPGAESLAVPGAESPVPGTESPAVPVQAEPPAPQAEAVAGASSEPPAAEPSESAATEPSEPAAADESAADEAGSPPPAAPAMARPAFDPRGTVHVVVRGDTLWDISNLYLGTPWIWPSIWKDNGDIADPHLIHPGDKIWVSASEMRKLTDEEAARLLAMKDALPAPEPPPAELELEPPVPAAMAEDAAPAPEPERERFEYVRFGHVGLVSDPDRDAMARIVGTPEEQVLLSQRDEIWIDRGAGQVEMGEELTLLKIEEQVWDPETRKKIGWHAEPLGFVEVTEVRAEHARAVVRQAYGDITPQDVYLVDRRPRTVSLELGEAPPEVEGQVVDVITRPKYHGGGEVVFLNRGARDGLVPGISLDVYRDVSDHWKENWYGERPDVELPHEVVAKLLVLAVEDRTAAALVRRTNTELFYGDHFRTPGGPDRPFDQRHWYSPLRWADEVASQLPGLPDWNTPRLPLPGLDGYDPR